MTWLVSVGVLGCLVLVHEWGHFVVARWVGVKVERFSIGFGPTLYTWRGAQTEYALSLIPLGGYVRLAGEQPTGRNAAGGEFVAKSARVRSAIIVAGPAVNYLVSAIALWAVLVLGYPELLPTVGKLLDDMPAKAAGLQIGDRVMAVDGQPIQTWDELTQLVRRKPQTSLTLDVERSGARLSVAVVPKEKEIVDPFGRHQRVGLIGVAPSGAFATYKLPPLEALGQTLRKQREWAAQTFLSLWSLITGRISMQESLTGPIGILYMTSEAARLGAGPLLYLISLFSLSLAVCNLFPVPVLDGGHLLFIALEKLRWKPVSLRTQERATQISFAALVALAIMVCIGDVHRFGLVDKVKNLWK